MHYENGWGVAVDLFVAEDWYRKARMFAKRPIGTPSFVLQNGVVSTEMSVDQWIESTREKALAGNVDAIFAMSQFYENGLFIAPNPEQAFRWHLEGARRGSKTGQFQVAYHYCRGLGVERDIQKSNSFAMKAELNVACKEIKEEK